MRMTISRCLLVGLLGISTLVHTGCKSTGSWPSFGSWSGKTPDNAGGLASTKPNSSLPPSPSSSFSPSSGVASHASAAPAGGAVAVGPGGYPTTGIGAGGFSTQQASATQPSGYYTGPYSTGGPGASGGKPAGMGGVSPAGGTMAGMGGPAARTADTRGTYPGMNNSPAGYSAQPGGGANPAPGAFGGAMQQGAAGYGPPSGGPSAANNFEAPNYGGSAINRAANPAAPPPPTGAPSAVPGFGPPAGNTPAAPPAGGNWGGAAPSNNENGFRPGSTSRGELGEGEPAAAPDNGAATGAAYQPPSNAGQFEPPAADPNDGRFVPPQQ